mmetsp:Transcript_28626/g.67674  ORF Transcript_28626/g.67674 Transcript_28626/m.67674 type:complete len:273 (+) Transcript_28626:742-1560(+)
MSAVMLRTEGLVVDLVLERFLCALQRLYNPPSSHAGRRRNSAVTNTKGISKMIASPRHKTPVPTKIQPKTTKMRTLATHFPTEENPYMQQPLLSKCIPTVVKGKNLPPNRQVTFGLWMGCFDASSERARMDSRVWVHWNRLDLESPRIVGHGALLEVESNLRFATAQFDSHPSPSSCAASVGPICAASVGVVITSRGWPDSFVGRTFAARRLQKRAVHNKTKTRATLPKTPPITNSMGTEPFPELLSDGASSCVSPFSCSWQMPSTMWHSEQ